MKTLETHFQEEIATIARMLDAAPFENKTFYYRWMCQQYYLVQNSTRYLALSASKVPVTDGAGFREWSHHVKEEIDHDLTLLKDMKKLGFTELMPLRPETRALIAAQYYDIETNGANALLGYALLLEGLSCERCKDLARRVKAAHGFDSVYLNLHGQVDEEHFPEGMVKIGAMNEKERTVVLNNLLMASKLYQHFLNETLKDCRSATNTTMAPELASAI